MINCEVGDAVRTNRGVGIVKEIMPSLVRNIDIYYVMHPQFYKTYTEREILVNVTECLEELRAL